MKMKDNEQINTASPIVEIFKTNVSDQQLANKIIMDLNQLFPDYNINFDLEDCDKVLRVKSPNSINIAGIVRTWTEKDIQIELINY